MPRLLTALLAAAAALSPAPPAAHAQPVADTLVFETLGDRALSADDLAFDDTGALWAAPYPVSRLAPGDSVWEEVSDPGGAYAYILPLGADTVLLGGSGIRRSVDGGRTFYNVHDEGERLFEVSSGRLIAGTRDVTGVAYSADRGQTWHEGVVVEGGAGTWQPHVEGVAELPAGHPHAGRLVAAAAVGFSYSDDGGATWHPSAVWDQRYPFYYGYDIVAAGSDGRVYGALYESGVFGLQIVVSEDGGARYERAYRFTTGSGFGARIVWVAGGPDPEAGVLVVVENDGEVHVSTDGALTWRQVGEVPSTLPFSRTTDAVVGPDGHLYVAKVAAGPVREWAFRSTAPVVAPAGVSVRIAPESAPVVVPASGGGVPFRLTLTNATDAEQRFDVWAEATLPDGSVVGPGGVVLGPVAVVLEPGQTLVRRLVQAVPAGAPAGPYVYTALAGAYPGGAVASDSFTGQKEPGASVGGSTAVASWSVVDATTGALVVAGEHWGADDAAGEGPSAFGLSVVPNPFVGRAEARLALPEAAAVTVAVYDVLGRRVAVLHEGPLAAGSHGFRLDGRGLPAGVYVVRAEAGGALATRTMTLLR